MDELARRLGKSSEIEVYEEDGLGTFRALWLKPDSGISILLDQSDHLTDVAMFGERAHKGPIIYIDAYDAIINGYEYFYWGVIRALGISEANIEAQYADKAQWLEQFAATRIVN